MSESRGEGPRARREASIDLRRKLLTQLQIDAETSQKDIARRIDTSEPSVSKMKADFKDKGIIKKIAAILDPAELGFKMLVFTTIRLKEMYGDHLAKAQVILTKHPNILEVHQLGSEWHFLIKIRTHTPEDVSNIFDELRKADHNIIEMRTMVVMGTRKETTNLPLEQAIFASE